MFDNRNIDSITDVNKFLWLILFSNWHVRCVIDVLYSWTDRRWSTADDCSINLRWIFFLLLRNGCPSLKGESSTPKQQKEDVLNLVALWTQDKGSSKELEGVRHVQVQFNVSISLNYNIDQLTELPVWGHNLIFHVFCLSRQHDRMSRTLWPHRAGKASFPCRLRHKDHEGPSMCVLLLL